MNYQYFLTHLPFAAGVLVGVGLLLFIIVLALIAFLWSEEE
jgi:hypothetical protein